MDLSLLLVVEMVSSYFGTSKTDLTCILLTVNNTSTLLHSLLSTTGSVLLSTTVSRSGILKARLLLLPSPPNSLLLVKRLFSLIVPLLHGPLTVNPSSQVIPIIRSVFGLLLHPPLLATLSIWVTNKCFDCINSLNHILFNSMLSVLIA